MPVITTPKIHHFMPLAREKVVQVNRALSGVPEALPEYKKMPMAMGATSYVFPEDHMPYRVDDILLVDEIGDKRVLSNREAPKEGAGRTTLFDHEAYDLDLTTRTLTFHKPLDKPYMMHWYVMDKAANFGADWVDASVAEFLLQGSNYIDEDLIPPGETNLTGKFQGSCRCFPEIVSLPTQGLIRKSDNLLGFSYRPRMGFIGSDSIEYLIYNSWGQVSDTCCLTFQMS